MRITYNFFSFNTSKIWRHYIYMDIGFWLIWDGPYSITNLSINCTLTHLQSTLSSWQIFTGARLSRNAAPVEFFSLMSFSLKLKRENKEERIHRLSLAFWFLDSQTPILAEHGGQGAHISVRVHAGFWPVGGECLLLLALLGELLFANHGLFSIDHGRQW